MSRSTIPRPGNLQRAEWRQSCRQILADHVRNKLGILIEPAQVRLIPAVEDGYLWRAIPEKKYLFTKQLSKLSIGAYMELCREVGKSFEAVESEQPDATIGVLEGDMQVPGVTASHPSFASEINHLREENTKLGEEVSRRQEEAAAEATARQHLEKKLDQLEVELYASRELIDTLTKENMRLASKVRRQTKRVGRSEREIKRALQVLQKIGPS